MRLLGLKCRTHLNGKKMLWCRCFSNREKASHNFNKVLLHDDDKLLVDPLVTFPYTMNIIGSRRNTMLFDYILKLKKANQHSFRRIM